MKVFLKTLVAACILTSTHAAHADALIVNPVSSGTATKVLPHAVFGTNVYNFGTVSEGTSVRGEFTVKNTGDEPLTFQKAIPSCGCLVTSGIDKPLLPDAETKIVVTFDTTGYSGSKVRTVNMQTNDPDHLTQVFTLKGTITAQIAIQPQVVNFGEITQGSSAKKTVTLKAGGSMHFGEVISTVHGVRVNEVHRTPNELTLEVLLDNTLPLGELRDRIVVAIDGGREPSVSVPVYAFVKGSIRLQPPQLSFGLVSQGTLLRRRLKLEQFGKDGFSILKTRSANPALSATAKMDNDKKHYIVEVVLDPSKVTTDIRGSVILETDLAGTPEITIPVYAVAGGNK